MTPVESASRPMLPSAFPDGVGLHGFLYGAQSHGPVARCLRFGPGVAPNAARLASSCAFGLGWTGLATRRVSFRGFSSWHPPQPDLGWRTRKDRRAEGLGGAKLMRLCGASRAPYSSRDRRRGGRRRRVPAVAPTLAFCPSDLPVKKSGDSLRRYDASLTAERWRWLGRRPLPASRR